MLFLFFIFTLDDVFLLDKCYVMLCCVSGGVRVECDWDDTETFFVHESSCVALKASILEALHQIPEVGVWL